MLKFIQRLELTPRPGALPLPIVNEDFLAKHPDAKLLYLVRHGQSEYNKRRRESFTKFVFSDMIKLDFNFRDAVLSDTGVSQATNLGKMTSKYYSDKDVEKVVVSPLSRAIQTGLFGMPHFSKGQFVCEESAAERIETTGDLGNTKEYLEAEFPAVDFSKLNPGHWRNPPVLEPSLFTLRLVEHESDESLSKRIQQLTDNLLAMPERRIMVVGHSMFFKYWTQGTKMQNCEVRLALLTKEGELVPLTDEGDQFNYVEPSPDALE